MLWFDLDNSPHVPLFRPILAELGKRKVPCVVTARDFAQTKELLSLWGIPHTVIGAHGGGGRTQKVLNLLQRSAALKKAMHEAPIRLAVSHGSRTQVLASWRMGLPSLVMLDYEYTESRVFNYFGTRIAVPAAIPDRRLRDAGFNLKKVIRYDGFKEEIYLDDFVPTGGFRRQIGVAENSILVTMRPPSTTGNYHDPRSEELFRACLDRFSSYPGVHILVIQRTSAESSLIPDTLRAQGNVSVLPRAVDGLQLVWHSDIVVSGGGTMNRESALLGTPTFSIFTGRRPYLDEYLHSQGKLRFIENPEQVTSIPVVKRTIPSSFTCSNPGLASRISDLIISLAQGSDS